MKIDYYERLGEINSVNLMYLWWCKPNTIQYLRLDLIMTLNEINIFNLMF